MKNSARLTVLLVMLLALVAATGCSAPAATTAAPTAAPTTAPTTAPTQAPAETPAEAPPTEPPKVTLSIYIGNQTYDPSNSIIAKAIADKTGVSLDWSKALANPDRSTAISLMLSSNDLTDIVREATPVIPNHSTEQLLPLDDLLLTHGKNLLAQFGDAIALSKALYSDDSHQLYFLPICSDNSADVITYPAKGWCIRWDLYKQLGCPAIDTNDELLDVFKKMMDLEPKTSNGQKTYGFGGFFGESWGYIVPGASIISMTGIAQMGLSPCSADIKTGELIDNYGDINNICYEALRIYNKAYRMGVLDPDSVAMKFTESLEAHASGKYMGMELNWLGADAANTHFIEQDHPEKGFVPVKVGVTHPDYAYINESQALGTNQQACISKNCKYPERAVDLFDYLSTEEGIMLANCGIKDQHYTIDANGYFKSLLPNPLPPDQAKEIGIGYYGGLSSASTSYIKRDPNEIWKDLAPVLKDYCNYYRYDKPMQVFNDITTKVYDGSIGTAVAITEGVAPDDIVSASTACTSYLQTAVPKLIFQETEEDFNNFRQQMHDELVNLGYDKLCEYYRQEYNKINTLYQSMDK